MSKTKVIRLAALTMKSDADRDMVKDWLKSLLASDSIDNVNVTKLELTVTLDLED
jgi:chorismate mutase